MTADAAWISSPIAILFSKYAGTEVSLDGEEHLIISEDDVLAILE